MTSRRRHTAIPKLTGQGRAGSRQQQPRHSPGDLTGLVDDLNAVVWEADPHTFRFTYVSRSAERLFGYPLQRWLEESDFWARHIHPDDRAHAITHCLTATSQGRDHEFEYRMLAADESVHWVRDIVRVSVDERGQTTGLRGVLIEVPVPAERAQQPAAPAAPDERNRAAAEYQDIFLGAPVGIARAALDGRILMANAAFARVLGYDRVEDLLQRNLATDICREQEDCTRLMAEAAEQEQPADLEVEWKRKDGNAVWARLSVQKGRYGPDQSPCLEVFVRDVNARRGAAQQVHQSTRMELIGQLAGGIAHDFNNMLTAILGYSELLLADMDPVDSRRADLNEIRKAAEQAAALTRQLLAFSRKQVHAVQSVDPNAVVRYVERMMRRLIGEDIDLQLHLAPDLGTVRSDPAQLEQVIVNLVLNARDAVPVKGGRIVIETANCEVDQDSAAGDAPVKPGPYVRIAVIDNGMGMDPKTSARMFEPFFTTKEPGKGTGIGLSTVFDIVKRSGGSVSVSSEVGRGSRFRIYLPRDANSAESAVSRIGKALVLRGKETVLLAEEEDGLRNLVRRTLTSHGYTVLEAAHWQKALSIAQTHPGPVDLLLTDAGTPVIDEADLATRIAAYRPGLRVLYMAGYIEAGIVQEGVLGTGVAFVQKPFAPDGLLLKVRQLLDASTSRGR